MKLETKFNKGERVWRLFGPWKCPHCNNSFTPPEHRWTVSSRMYTVYDVRAGYDGTYYDDSWLTGESRFCKSSDLFLSKEEAQAECDKRNGVADSNGKER